MKRIESFNKFNEKRGLWANIHNKRKRGEAPAKPGDEDYPKPDAVKNAQESIKESKINEPSDIIKDLDKVRFDLIKQVEVLIAKKKELYSNMDIESPMSADEKKLDKDIQSIFSEIQGIIQQKRKINKK